MEYSSQLYHKEIEEILNKILYFWYITKEHSYSCNSNIIRSKIKIILFRSSISISY